MAEAGPLDVCAQRVIRDWYSGGRVDQLYPLACYRAAIRALPNDVLEYSDADKDIARALAVARRAQTDDAEREERVDERTETPTAASPGVAPPGVAPPGVAAPEAPTDETTTPSTGSAVRGSSPPSPPSRPRVTTPPTTPAPALDGPRRVAAGPEAVDVSSAVPYPVIVLGALAGTLLAMGAAGWLLARRR